MPHSESPGNWTGAQSDTVARGGGRWGGRGIKGRLEGTLRRVRGQDREKMGRDEEERKGTGGEGEKVKKRERIWERQGKGQRSKGGER